MRASLGVVLSLLWLVPTGAAAVESPAPGERGAVARIEVEPREATVGDRLQAIIEVEEPGQGVLETAPVGPELGKLSVLHGVWSAGVVEDGVRRWTWKGELAAFEVGELELPAVRLRMREDVREWEIATEPLAVTIRSVLEEPAAEGGPELADIRPPASIPPDYRALWAALGLLALLSLGAGLLWWLHRRLAPRLAAVEAPEDPFRRVAPHVWVYAELQRLLDRRLPESGQIDLFYSEVARILKRYLGGRFRVDLLERTTGEVRSALEQAACGAEEAAGAESVMQLCDRVKFARERPGSTAWREIVERIYAIVDRTKPAESVGAAERERGAA